MEEPGTYVALRRDHSVFDKDPEGFRDESGKNVLRQFGPLRAINLIVGPNNSGKSRFVRGLFRDPQNNNLPIIGEGPIPEWAKVENRVEQLAPREWRVDVRELPHLATGQGVQLARWSNCSSVLSQIKRTPFTPDGIDDEWLRLRTKAKASLPPSLIQDFLANEREATAQETADLDLFMAWGNWRAKPVGKSGSHRPKLYIPQLRTALRLAEAKETSFFETLENFYWNKGQSNYQKPDVRTGQDLHTRMDRALRGSRVEREKFRQFQRWFQLTFFPGRSVEFIPRHTEAGNQIAIDIDGEDRDIQHLGDGLQHLVLLAFPLFMAEKGTIAFIEEPESHLHPGFQRVFFEMLRSRELQQNELKVVCTTHSNHLLALAFQYPDESSIFSFSRVEESKDKRYVRVKHIRRRDVDLLTQLGVHNSSVFLSQSTVWVEGPSDIISFRAYYKAYQDELYRDQYGFKGDRMLEDRDFTFLQYGGTNLEAYSFDETQTSSDSSTPAWSLSNRIFLIADEDANKEDKHKKYEEIAKRHPNSMRYKTTGVCELENLISPALWKLIFPKVFPNAKPPNGFAFEIDPKKRVGDYFKDKKVLSGNETNLLTHKSVTRRKTDIANMLQALPVRWNQTSLEAKQLMCALDDFIRESCGQKAVEQDTKDKLLAVSSG